MRHSTIVFISLILFSCADSSLQKEPQKETPEALQENSSAEVFSRGGNRDLVESLYQELLTKTPELKKFETEISILKNSQGDSTYLFHNYNQRNQSYFNAANLHSMRIKDSVLRKKIKELISGRQANYDSMIFQHTTLLKVIEEKTTTLNELHEVLKITRTLPLIEKYQKDNVPSTKPLQGFINNVDRTIKTADTLVSN